MSNQDEALSPAAFQARIAQMQAEFQQKLAELQAAGDVAAIATLSAQYQADVTALTQHFQAAMGGVAAGAGGLSPVAAQQQDEYDAVPGEDECARLMLLGAMYVEENNMLEHMRQMIPAATLAEQPKPVLIEFFSSLDMNMEGVDPRDMQYLLSDSWGVESAEALKNTLAWLLKEGHNKELMHLIDYCNTQPSPQGRTLADFRQRFDQPLAYDGCSSGEFENLLLLADNLQAKLTTAGIWGWDAARYVHVLRLGYMAQYLSANECWAHLRRLWAPVTERFESWPDFVHSYTYGYRWWSGTSGPIEDACHRLLADPNSPWLFFGWFAPPSRLH